MNGPSSSQADRAAGALDRETLRRAVRRDPAALDAFFERFFDRAFGYVATLVGDRPLAEDLTQEAFLRMHHAIHRLDPERDPTPWVFTVLTNVVRDHWRGAEHRSRERRAGLDAAGDVPADEGADAASRRETEEDARAIRRALASLSQSDREVIVLRAYEGLSSAEAARAAGIADEALRQRYARAVKRLGRAFAEVTAEPAGSAPHEDRGS